MKPLLTESTSFEHQSNELWQIYVNRQQYGNKDVPQEAFEHRFWQHYDNLRVRAISKSHLVSPPTPKQKVLKNDRFEYGIQQDLNTIFRKYWTHAHQVNYKQNSVQVVNKNNHNYDSGCLLASMVIVFAIISIALIAFSLYWALLVWVFLGIGVLSINDFLQDSNAHKIDLRLQPSFIAYQEKTPEGQIIKPDMPYKNIHSFWKEEAQLKVIGKVKGKTQEILISNKADGFQDIQTFIQEIVTYNYMRQ